MDNTGALILGVALMIIMVGMGMSLTMADFKRIMNKPLAVFVGFLNQIVLLPLLAFGIIKMVDPNLDDPNIAIGLMILAACPGGPTSNMLTHLAKGDTALSVSLTAVNSVITIVSIPFIINWSLGEFSTEAMTIEAPVKDILKALIAVVLVPLVIGMLIKNKKEAFAQKMDKPVKIASAVVLAVVIIALVLKEKANIVPYFERALIMVSVLNLGTMLIGFLSAKLFKLNTKQALCITIESGNQNGTLAMTVAISLLGSTELAITAAVYSLVMFITAAIPVWLGNKWIKD